MKTETAIVLVVLIIGGLAAYKVFSNNAAQTAATPLGANIGTLTAAGAVAGGVLGGLENLFSGSNSSSGGDTLASDTTDSLSNWI